MHSHKEDRKNYAPPQGEEHPKRDRKRILSALVVPTLLIAVLWLVFWAEHLFGWRLYQYGIKPRSFEGLTGILTGPFIHGDLNHLFDNSVPLLFLGWALFYFYRKIAFQVLLWTFLMGGVWVWVSARGSYHIGASGVIYGLASFLFLSGMLRRHTPLMAFSMIVVFLYGSLWWGVLPVKPGISWEGHLWGAVAGVILALYFQKEGPQRPLYQWEIDEREEEQQRAHQRYLRQHPHARHDHTAGNAPGMKVHYHYKPGDEEKGEE